MRLADCNGSGREVIGRVAALAPGCRFAGPAVTAKETAGAYGSFASEDFRAGAMIDAAQARDDAAALEDLKAGLTFSRAMAKYEKI